jgi:DNA-binding CsgD family transcriptional regulator
VSKPFRGVINVDVRDSEPDWRPFEPPRAPDSAPSVLYIVLDDIGFSALGCHGGPVDTAEAADRPPLTPAELRLLPYLQTHLTAERIAGRLSISIHTVNAEVRSIYRKLGTSSRGDAAQKARAIGLLGA